MTRRRTIGGPTQLDLFAALERRDDDDDDDDDAIDDDLEFDAAPLSQDVIALRDNVIRYRFPIVRPKTRADCVNVPRPCPFVSCRYNLYLDISVNGRRIRINFKGEPDEMSVSCALDLAEDGPRGLIDVGRLIGTSKERARQVEEVAMEKLKRNIAYYSAS